MKANYCVAIFLVNELINAQNQNIETEIRSLEQIEVKAVLKKTPLCFKNCGRDYVVNSPVRLFFPVKPL
jgi:hypothetical protein